MKHDLGKFDLSKQQVLDLIDAYIFNERNRQIVVRRLIDGVCYENLADEYSKRKRGNNKSILSGSRF